MVFKKKLSQIITFFQVIKIAYHYPHAVICNQYFSIKFKIENIKIKLRINKKYILKLKENTFTGISFVVHVKCYYFNQSFRK